MFVYACRQLAGQSVHGHCWQSPVSVFLPLCCRGITRRSHGSNDWWAPARMLFVSVPFCNLYAAMSQLGMMFQHANSPGAAFILLVLGAGMNLGTIGWMARQFGSRSVFVWVVCLMVVVTAIAYAVNRPLIPPGVNPSPHTHAFDVYTNPIHHLDSSSADFAIAKLGEKFGLVEQIGVAMLGFLGFAGIILRLVGISESKLARSTPADSTSPSESPGVNLKLGKL